jgi:hypothetical protein
MSNYTALSNVGKTLVSLLWSSIKEDPQVNSIITTEDQISLSSPKEIGSQSSKKLSIFLYHITEFPSMRNQEMSVANPTSLSYPPLCLELHYLITPYTQNEESDHIILGKIMQIFLDNAILRGSILKGDLADDGEELRLVMDSLSMDDLNKMWSIFDKQYKLCISYRVSPVRIDSTREAKVTRVTEQTADYSEKGAETIEPNH